MLQVDNLTANPAAVSNSNPAPLAGTGTVDNNNPVAEKVVLCCVSLGHHNP
jgi:hypothetical protein